MEFGNDKMSNKIIDISNISSDYLNDDTYETYDDMISRFEARKERYTSVLRNKQKELSTHPSLDKRIYNNTTLLL